MEANRLHRIGTRRPYRICDGQFGVRSSGTPNLGSADLPQLRSRQTQAGSRPAFWRNATRQNGVRSSVVSLVVATARRRIGGALRTHFAVGSRRAVRSFDPTYDVKAGADGATSRRSSRHLLAPAQAGVAGTHFSARAGVGDERIIWSRLRVVNQQLAFERAERWVPVTSTGMTPEGGAAPRAVRANRRFIPAPFAHAMILLTTTV